MDSSNLHTFTETLIRDASFGLGFLAIILLLNTFLFVRISFWFKKTHLVRRKHINLILTSRFMVAVLLICVVQILSILLWATAIYLKGLINDPTLAMLFAGSCYTTLGIYSDLLPQGWKALALYIAFSGLFSFAIATSAMISMLGVFSKMTDNLQK